MIDTDGAFIPSSQVIEKDGLEHIKYFDNKIESACPTNTIRRNSQKLQVVKRLYNCHKINEMKYYMLYFSRNLEHALENDDSELTDDQKVNYADDFADKYEKDIPGFMDLINSDSLAVKGSYTETWDYIFKDDNSLKRNSNFHLLFKIYDSLTKTNKA